MTSTNSQFTRSGARRAGDDYQDIIALEVVIEWLEHNDRYKWIKVEANEMGYLDDIVALLHDGKILARQVKYSTNPNRQDDPWTWKNLLDQSTAKNGKKNLSLLQKWASSLKEIAKQFPIFEASVYSNRRAATEITSVIRDGFINFDQIRELDIRQKIESQLGKTYLHEFFAIFQFRLNQPGLYEIEEGLRKRFGRLGGTEIGWLNLKNQLRDWIINRNALSPNGIITLHKVKNAAIWYTLQSLPQRFEIPSDYVVPSEDFHQDILNKLKEQAKKCLVIKASPGVGKSTYISYLFDNLCELGIPVIRHHYYLSLEDRRRIDRLDHMHAAESLMYDLKLNYADSLGGLDSRNSSLRDLLSWLETSGAYYKKRGKYLVVLVDGLDHVWREQRSIKELEEFINILLPAPDGVIVLLATQPVENNKLPRSLLCAAPKPEWLELPLLDKSSVKEWLSKHAKEISQLSDEGLQDSTLERLTDALYKKSMGHPLHLRYSLKSLIERNKQVTVENILELPECVHKDITKYYEELWSSLGEESREILHLLSACPFPWPRDGIFDCMDPQSLNLSRVRNSLSDVEHLLIHNELGLRPFHSSLYAYIEATPDHSVYIITEKKRALAWLKVKAPLYWKWAYEWIIEAELGNNKPLFEGPTRKWAIDAVSKRYAIEDIDLIISRSKQIALTAEDLPRAVELGLLQEYCNNVFDFQENVLEILINSQLILEEDNCIRARLRSNLEQLDEKILAALASVEYRHSNDAEIKQIFQALIQKHRYPQKNGRHKTWQEIIRPVLETAALLDSSQFIKAIDWAISNRENGYTLEMLYFFIARLRALKRSDHLRSILTSLSKSLNQGNTNDLSNQERDVILQEVTLYALEEDLDIDQELSKTNSDHPILAIYSRLKSADLKRSIVIKLPSIEQLNIMQYDFSIRNTLISNFFRYSFLCLLANCLNGKPEENLIWLTDISQFRWSHKFIHNLGNLAANAAVRLLAKIPITPGWVYNQLNGFPRIKWPENRDETEYSEASLTTLQMISFDLLIFSMSFDRTIKIDVSDVEEIFKSDYCHPMKWIENYLLYERYWMNNNAVQWIIQDQIHRLETEVEEFPTRAEEYGILAYLTVTHNFLDNAQDFIQKASEYLVAHYQHKDMLIVEAMDVIHLCHPLYKPEETPNSNTYLLQLAPAIAKIDSFTDGDETSQLPGSLATILADVDISKLPKYYQWLCEIDEPSDALHVLNVLLKKMDLSDPVAKAIAQTAVDEESLSIINERADEDDIFAKEIISSINNIIGKTVGNLVDGDSRLTDTTRNPKDSIYKEELPSYIDFPPDHVIDFFTMLNNRKVIFREEKVLEWISFWIASGKKLEVYEGLVKVIESGYYFRNFDEVFGLCLSLFGKDKAYPWLIQAQKSDNGWYRYFTREENAKRRWRIIKEYYPDKWFDFIQKTFSTGSLAFYRLISYLLYFDQEEMAKTVLNRIVTCVLDYVSPGNFPRPGWISDEQQNA